MRFRFLLVAILISLPLLASLAIATPRVSAAPMYTITDLGTLGGDVSRAHGLNDQGVVVGEAERGPGKYKHAFRWANGKMEDLGSLKGDDGISQAYDINEQNQIVGTSANCKLGDCPAFLWQDGSMTALPAPAGALVANAQAINSRGQIVGSFTFAGPVSPVQQHAILWQRGETIDLGVLEGDQESQASDINDAGAVVGSTWNNGALGTGHAFKWQNGSMSRLPELNGYTNSGAGDVNSAGDIVGTSNSQSKGSRAVLWQYGQARDLGTLQTYQNSSAWDINDLGQIVGTSFNRQGTPHAWLWQDGLMLDINSLIPPSSSWEVVYATKINNRGQIAGYGLYQGNSRAFLLSPTNPPRPSPTSPPLPSGSSPRCFTETNKCMQSLFLDYWQANGGLAINGFPISDTLTEVLEDGKLYTVQYFERVRMEYHPEANDRQYQVQLGQFGRRIHPADPAVAAVPGMTYFSETGHNVPPDFLGYWQAQGGLAQFGFPLSEVFRERLEDGKEYEVQYFERARFERHPENAAPNIILLGQFGRKVLSSR